MRSLASAMWAAEDFGLQLVMTWEPDRHLRSAFSEVFRNRFLRAPTGFRTAPTRLLKEPTSVYGMIQCDDPDDMVYHIASCQAFSHRRDEEAYTRTFWVGLRPYLLRLKPVRSVRRTVRAVSARFADRTLGVHVRAGLGRLSFEQAAHIDPDLFFEEVDDFLATGGESCIFLACDSPGVRDDFRRRYGGRVVVQPHADDGAEVGEIDPAGIRMALADMLLLSKTDRILGSYFSSFSELASVLGACPVKRIGREVEGPGWEEDFLDLVPWSIRGSRFRRFLRRFRASLR
jgi:hypothetical protein